MQDAKQDRQVIHPWVAEGHQKIRAGVSFLDNGVDWKRLSDAAQATEELGYDSIWVPDHPIILPDCWGQEEFYLDYWIKLLFGFLDLICTSGNRFASQIPPAKAREHVSRQTVPPYSILKSVKLISEKERKCSMKNNKIILNHIVIDLFLGTKPQTERSTILADYHKTTSQC
jgi:hypothetical protein